MLLAKYKAENRQIKSILIPIKKKHYKSVKVKKKKKKNQDSGFIAQSNHFQYDKKS